MKYGSGADDPLPFILTLTPSYVAREMQQIMPIPLQDVVDYARRNKERLRILAQLAKWEGPEYPSAGIGQMLHNSVAL